MIQDLQHCAPGSWRGGACDAGRAPGGSCGVSGPVCDSLAGGICSHGTGHRMNEPESKTDGVYLRL